MKESHNKYITLITWMVRLLTGGLFIFSGFTKGIDPWGTIYKVDDYINVLGINIWHNLKVVFVFGLCALEFITGVFLLLGCFRRSWPIVAALIMAFMLPLSLWIAIDNPVAECGCFGDALIISNWATFWKNVLLTIGIIFLIRYNTRCSCLVTPSLQWIAFIIGCVYIVVIGLIGYNYQPLIDFRAYKTGNMLVSDEEMNFSSDYYKYIYEKDGERIEIGEDDEIPDESQGWHFVERVDNGIDPAIKDSNDLKIFDRYGEEDETSDVIDKEGNQLFLLMPDLREVSPATTWKINSLYEWSEKNDIGMAAIVAGSSDEIDEWEDLSMPAYPIFTADDTQLKEVARGNPSVIYLENGIIKWKSTLSAINIDDFLEPEISSDASVFAIDNNQILFNCTSIYLIIMAVLIVLSFTPKLLKLITADHTRRLIHDDKVHR